VKVTVVVPPACDELTTYPYLVVVCTNFNLVPLLYLVVRSPGTVKEVAET
jgi:hypothetical protein